MVSQEKEEKIFIFNNRNVAKNKEQTLDPTKVYMASQEKQEKIFIFNNRNLAKNKIFFNFSWQNKVTTNPRPYSRSIWHHSKNKKKYLFLTQKLGKKQGYF